MNSKEDTPTFEEQWKQRIFMQCSCCFTNYTFEEYMKCGSFWVDKDEKYGKEAACSVCGKLFHKGKWQIKSYKKPYVLYTTHTEMPQCPPNFTEDIMNSQYFWESMIENEETGKWLEFQARYKTQQDAIDGHWMAYDKMEDILLNPDKYPSDLISTFCNAMEAVRNQKKNIDPHVKRNLV